VKGVCTQQAWTNLQKPVLYDQTVTRLIIQVTDHPEGDKATRGSWQQDRPSGLTITFPEYQLDLHVPGFQASSHDFKTSGDTDRAFDLVSGDQSMLIAADDQAASSSASMIRVRKSHAYARDY
jgi:hypothetical protein